MFPYGNDSVLGTSFSEMSCKGNLYGRSADTASLDSQQ